jgi:hypothetical protein
LRNVARGAFGFTLTTVLLAWVYAGPQDSSCDGGASAPAWTGPVGWLAVISAIAAVVLGLTGLAARRWFVALICLIVNPVALLYMVASTGAFC